MPGGRPERRARWRARQRCRLDVIPERYRALVLLATFASLRFGELATLRRDEIDLERCAVRIVAATTETDTGHLIDHDPKSQAGRRTVGTPSQAGVLTTAQREVIIALTWAFTLERAKGIEPS